MKIKYLNRETISYLICGVLTTLVSFASYVLCVHLGLSTVMANTISNVLAILFAYVTNKIFVFQSPSWALNILVPEFLKFCGARLGTFIVETMLLVLLVDVMNLPSILMKGITTILVVVGNYVLSKWMVFTKK